jgi:hypothetical protein
LDQHIKYHLKKDGELLLSSLQVIFGDNGTTFVLGYFVLLENLKKTINGLLL